MLGLDIVFPLTLPVMGLLVAFVYFVTDRAKKVIPQSPRQNWIIRGLSVVTGIAGGVVCMTLMPGFHYDYHALVGAIVQGGGVGCGLTLGVWGVYAMQRDPGATDQATPATPTK